MGQDDRKVSEKLCHVKNGKMCIRDRYKGVEVEKADASVSAEDVEAELKKVQEQNARLLTVEDRDV